MPYEFLEDLATADIAFQAWGRDLEETFISAGDATMNVMVEELNAIQPRERREFRLENEELDLLLFNLLQELIYYKDAEKLMLRVNQARVQAEARPYVLEAIAWGETLDPERHHPRVDVKAVTLHHFRLEKTERGWEALVILDI
jgi:SHS2 domain-containing protein